MAEMNVYSLFIHASLVVKLVIIILVIFSVVSWAIIIQRSRLLRQSIKNAERFEDKFWSGIDLAQLYQESNAHRDNLSGTEQIFHSGFKEFTRLYQLGTHEPETVIEGASRAMRISFNREIENAENQIPMLGIIGSVSPYIGLFGTVWGIMNSFMALQGAKQATLQMVAPGIAEALIATAIGLFAAIPAVIAYNRLTVRVSKLEQNYDNFTEEFIAVLYRQAFAVDRNKDK